VDLHEEFSYVAELKPPQDVGAGPGGHRMFIEIAGGEVEGERISGRLLSGGGDWLLLGTDGFGRLDVRGQIETGDGAIIYISYRGLLELTEGVMGVLGGGDEPTGFGDQYFRIAPQLECGHSDYAWVNQTMFVGEGRVLPGPGVEYRVQRVG
jgi:hypothetical protein